MIKLSCDLWSNSKIKERGLKTTLCCIQISLLQNSPNQKSPKTNLLVRPETKLSKKFKSMFFALLRSVLVEPAMLRQ